MGAAREVVEAEVEAGLEEEEELFPKVEKKLGEEKLLALGLQMKERFDEVVQEGFDAVVPEGCEVTSADNAVESISAPAA